MTYSLPFTRPHAAWCLLPFLLACGPTPQATLGTHADSMEAEQGSASAYRPGMHPYDAGRSHGKAAVVGKLASLPFGHRDAAQRTGTYFIPEHGSQDILPVLVLTHGFKATGHYMVQMWLAEAKKHKVALLAPDSKGDQWSIPDAGKTSGDSQHVQDALVWLRSQIGHPSVAHVGVAGHSFGCRMAASLASNFPIYRAGLLMHGRYEPESIGHNKVPLWMSGSPADNEFSFPVMVQQHAAFPKQFSGWPQGGPSLHTYACNGCLHAPHIPELSDAIEWFLGHT
jgi:pimeloyl-ACP methyl ester carboxylesterase